MSSPGRYHHGALRQALLEAAVVEIATGGPARLNLRELARSVGVSHAAPRHHFGDKRGLLTAVAAEGFDLLGAALGQSWEATRSFREVGVAYVQFAIEHPAHFAVMFRPELLDPNDPALTTAQARTRRLLYEPVTTVPAAADAGDPRVPAIAAWSLVHGLATLLLAGNLPDEMHDDPETLARAVTGHLF